MVLLAQCFARQTEFIAKSIRACTVCTNRDIGDSACMRSYGSAIIMVGSNWGNRTRIAARKKSRILDGKFS